MRLAAAAIPLASLFLSGCLCNALMGAAGAMQSKPTITDKTKLGAMKSAALVGVCHIDKMGYRQGGAMVRMAIGEPAGSLMRDGFAAKAVTALAPVNAIGITDALAKTTTRAVPANTICTGNAGPFGPPATSGAFDSIEPVIDTASMKTAAETLGVDVAFAVMMVPGQEFDGDTSRVFSSGIIHSTVYGVDRTGAIVFQQAIDAKGEAPGHTDADIAAAAGKFGENLGDAFAKALAAAC